MYLLLTSTASGLPFLQLKTADFKETSSLKVTWSTSIVSVKLKLEHSKTTDHREIMVTGSLFFTSLCPLAVSQALWVLMKTWPPLQAPEVPVPPAHFLAGSQKAQQKHRGGYLTGRDEGGLPGVGAYNRVYKSEIL